MKFYIIIFSILFSSTSLTIKSQNHKNNPPKVKKEWSDFVKKNAICIESLSADSFTDLNALKLPLQGKRIVMLGEGNHHVAEYNILKSRLIKFLHQEMGFDVLVFESGLAEMAFLNLEKKTNSDAMLSLSVWNVKENIPLMNYIKSDSLTVAGCDIQLGYYKNAKAFIKKYTNLVSNNLTDRLFRLDSLFLFASDWKSKEHELFRDSLLVAYKQMITLVNIKEQELLSSSISHENIKILKKELENRYTLIGAFGKTYTFEMRDSLMASTLTWIINDLYPNKKIIVWAHNYHISKNNSTSNREQAIMSSMLPPEIKKQSYVIGLFMCKYKHYTFLSKLIDKKIASYSLETILNESRYKYSFLDMSQIDKKNDENEWLFKPIETLSFNYKSSFILKNSFDGIIFIDKGSKSHSLIAK